MKNILSLLVAVCFFASCSKQEETPPIPKIKKYFYGVTTTDNSGNIIQADSSDWTLDSIWQAEEIALFDSVYNTGCTPPYAYKIGAFPNPFIGTFNLSVDQSSASTLSMRLVDENLNIIYSNDMMKGSSLSIDLTQIPLKDTLRLYYKFIENNCEFKGHGDVIFQ